VKPNIMQCQSKDFPVSFVITDPKGTLISECGKMLKNNKYRIKILNTIDFKKSMRYNPFAYIRSEKDILKFVTALINNTRGDGKAGEEFWTKAEQLLYQALIGYIWYEAPPEEQNMNTLVEMINRMEVREENESFKNAVDFTFEALEEQEPQHFAVRQYKKFKLAAGVVSYKRLIYQI
jgi:type IV secretion system protein VirD4